jgi:hypothetical protein
MIQRLALYGLLIFVFANGAADGSAQRSPANTTRMILSFNQTEYIHRWAQDDLHEFTPAGQEDLSKWTDMISVNFYPQVTDGDGLARVANQVLENYKADKGIILRTNSTPRTAEKPAEHFIAAVLGRPAFLEAVQARFKLVNGKGVSIIYSHRLYGQAAGPDMSNWLKDHGAVTEKTLMTWEVPASFGSLQKARP